MSELNVSRETQERLETYVRLLKQWNPKINLVAKSTLDDIWDRHILDSAQVLVAARVEEGIWFDMGSGGGFPGLVVAILAAEQRPDMIFYLCDSDQRKCAFLRTVVRETGVQAKVSAARLEELPSVGASVISARALASLADLLPLALRHGKTGHTALFQKGRNWREEVSAAQKEWRFQHEALPSKTDPEAVILRVEEIEHV